ncbi:MAG TPA: CPBP family glutamic-type intramembrane protease [Blastocatellia bacterium]|nr:CPBP family glutamic-type intramembrane protease [Blastocatellia bacterium]
MATPAPSRLAAAAELGCLVFCIEAIQWVVPLTRNPRAAYLGLAVVILMLLAVCYIRDGVSAKQLGFRFDNFFRALARIVLPLGIFVALAFLIGMAAGSLRFGKKFFSMLLFVPSWALLQQYMLLAFASPRLRVLFGDGRRNVLAAAALFALLHLPNPVLMVVCAVGGYVWARVYEREPNLFAAALTHAVASAFLANSLPGWLLKNMVTGYNYFFR